MAPGEPPGAAPRPPDHVYVVDDEPVLADGTARPARPPRYSPHLLQPALHMLGAKPRHAQRMCERVFARCTPGALAGACCRGLPEQALPGAVALSRGAFEEVVSCELSQQGYAVDMDDLRVAMSISERRRSVSVLLSGTSGCGKSTLASLLAAHLGITTVVSTDSLRHVLRSKTTAERDPILFASSYEAGDLVTAVGSEAGARARGAGSVGGGGSAENSGGGGGTPASQSADRRCIIGYKDQSSKVISQVGALLARCEQRLESVVVEGVHLSLNLVVELMRRHRSAVPFLIYIRDENKHRERFAVRAKYMTLDPAKNKYVKYLRNIRTIQDWLITKADKVGVPRLSNSNVDRSVSILSSTVFACVKHMAAGKPLLVERAPRQEQQQRAERQGKQAEPPQRAGEEQLPASRKRSARPVRELFSAQVASSPWTSKGMLAFIRRHRSDDKDVGAASDHSDGDCSDEEHDARGSREGGHRGYGRDGVGICAGDVDDADDAGDADDDHDGEPNDDAFGSDVETDTDSTHVMFMHVGVNAHGVRGGGSSPREEGDAVSQLRELLLDSRDEEAGSIMGDSTDFTETTDDESHKALRSGARGRSTSAGLRVAAATPISAVAE